MLSTTVFLAALYDRFSSQKWHLWLEHAVARVSAISFLIHLFLVFLCRNVPSPGPLLSAVGDNYLAAIFTPFSIILFYEALMLITAIPQSITRSVAKQFEIFSLIFIRRFFKDIAHLDEIHQLSHLSAEVTPIFLNLAAGLVMFALVAVFMRVSRHRHPRDLSPKPGAHHYHSDDVERFIARKKLLALALIATLFCLAAYTLCAYGVAEYHYLYLGAAAPDSSPFFYTDLFTVMIFTDVFIVISSLVVSDNYELVFRNEAFVISTILLRFSLTVDQPSSSILAISGAIFGILTRMLYNYLSGLNGKSEEPAPAEPVVLTG